MSDPTRADVCPVEQNRIARAAYAADPDALAGTVAADLVDMLANEHGVPQHVIACVVVSTLQLAAREHVVRCAINNAAQVYALQHED